MSGGDAPAVALISLVERFAFPRYPGSEGERRAADLVAAEFASAGIEVEREPFHVSTRAVARLRTIAHVLAASLALVLGAATPRHPIVATFAGAAFLALLFRSGTWPIFFERFFDAPPCIESENVTGRARASDSPRPIRLVFLAHLDSKSSRDPTFVPVALVLGATLLVLVLFLRAVLAAIHLVSAPPIVLTIPLSLFAAAALVRALVNPSGNESPGAMDNASGLAILVDAARTLPHDPTLDSADLTFVATGAEEIGLAGAMRWIQAHAGEFDRARTLFVNVDSVGVGRGIWALDVHGRTPDGRSMREVIREASRGEGVRARVLPGLPGVGVDTMPIAARGFPTVTILGQVLGNASRRIHSSRDTTEALGEAGMDDARRVVRGIARSAVSGR